MTGRGIARLAQAIDARTMKKTAAPHTLDFGTIDQDGGLQLDQFGPPIPTGDYLIAEWTMDVDIPPVSRLAQFADSVTPEGDDTPATTLSPVVRIDFTGSGDAGKISDARFQLAPRLKPGDRVLVLWVRDEAVVISKVGVSDA